ncbi:MAG TPA: ATP-binding cassette domain-containing protein [Ilumatobacter sp.]|nr:ATP-binding cassette domain-containing protein [Ilumatobacter sp.]
MSNHPQTAPDPAASAASFAAHGLWKHYGGVAAVRDVSIDFPAGSVTAIVGDNGAGKSTLIKMLCGAIQPDRGHIVVNGVEQRFTTPAAARQAGIATVYQDLALADHRNVAENLFLGRELVRSFGPVKVLRRADMRRDAIAALADLKIQVPDVRREARTLSGGQRQGVAIARAVHQGASILVMDEPMAALGLQEQGRVIGLVERLAERGLTQLIVSHNLDHVFRLSTRIVVMRLGQLVAVRDTADTDRSEVLHLISGIEPARARSGATREPGEAAQ